MIGLPNRSLYMRVTGRGGDRRLGVMVTSFALLPILADCSSFSFSSAPSSTSAPSSVSPSQSASPSAPKGPKFNHSSLGGSHECKYGTAYCIICLFQPQAAGLRLESRPVAAVPAKASSEAVLLHRPWTRSALAPSGVCKGRAARVHRRSSRDRAPRRAATNDRTAVGLGRLSGVPAHGHARLAERS
jgi:hypothetical protein